MEDLQPSNILSIKIMLHLYALVLHLGNAPFILSFTSQISCCFLSSSVSCYYWLLHTVILIKNSTIKLLCLQFLCTLPVLIGFVLAAVSDAKSYIIISQLPADIYRKFVEDASLSHLSGLTFVVVGIIHLSGGKITEENLWHHLRRLGLHENEEHHPNFGNSKMALEALVQQRYLQREKVNGPEGNTVYYELAERALDADFYDRIKEYVTQIVQKDVTSLEAD